jgi:hypothetical protein
MFDAASGWGLETLALPQVLITTPFHPQEET